MIILHLKHNHRIDLKQKHITASVQHLQAILHLHQASTKQIYTYNDRKINTLTHRNIERNFTKNERKKLNIILTEMIKFSNFIQ